MAADIKNQVQLVQGELDKLNEQANTGDPTDLHFGVLEKLIYSLISLVSAVESTKEISKDDVGNIINRAEQLRTSLLNQAETEPELTIGSSRVSEMFGLAAHLGEITERLKDYRLKV